MKQSSCHLLSVSVASVFIAGTTEPMSSLNIHPEPEGTETLHSSLIKVNNLILWFWLGKSLALAFVGAAAVVELCIYLQPTMELPAD